MTGNKVIRSIANYRKNFICDIVSQIALVVGCVLFNGSFKKRENDLQGTTGRIYSTTEAHTIDF